MVKKLLMIMAVASLATSANAYDLPLEDLAAGWNSQYDAATHTISYEGDWSGRGWWLDNVDYSAYDKVVIEVAPLTITGQLVVEYNGADMSTSGFCDLGTSMLSVPLDPNGKSSVKQIYIQCGQLTANPTIVINSAQVVANDPGAEDVLWQGSYTASGWNAGAQILKSQVKAGDLLHYTMTPGADGAQAIIKGADWKDLVGTAKITNSSIIGGVVEVLVTQEMLDNCGGQIFLQGDGGISCSKIEVVGEIEDVEGTQLLNFGARALPAEVFTKIPEDATSISLMLSAVPEWIQICNQSWTALVDNESASVYEDDGMVLMTFPVDADVIAAINANSYMVINGDPSVTYIATAIVDEIPEAEPLYTVGQADNTTPWWTAWSPTYAITGDGSINFEFVNYSSMEKNWDNWLAVLLNADVNPAKEGYAGANELCVIRCDNWGWGPLFDNATLTNNYDWENFTADMNGSHVDLTVYRAGEVVTLAADITATNGKEFEYTVTIPGVTSEILGVFLTTELGHLEVYDVTVDGTTGISDIIVNEGAKRFYNLNGIEVPAASLAPGLYIVKQNDKASKVLIR